jgi:8-oxo-dGTP pyrophosphatase MutT (NUDIX family)
MELSCGFIIFKKGTDMVLGCHPTGHHGGINSMDIPKGHIEKGETPLDAAKRELKEETGLVIPNDVEIHEIGRRHYQSKKSLHLFSVEMDIDIDSLHCDSTFVDSFGNVKPENDRYIWTNNPDTFFKNMSKHVKEEMSRRGLLPRTSAS